MDEFLVSGVTKLPHLESNIKRKTIFRSMTPIGEGRASVSRARPLDCCYLAAAGLKVKAAVPPLASTWTLAACVPSSSCQASTS